jgi:hypothetical protein
LKRIYLFHSNPYINKDWNGIEKRGVGESDQLIKNDMERKCLFCEILIDLRKHGLTKFCSAQCRNKYYYQNRGQKGMVGTTFPLDITADLNNEKINFEQAEINHLAEQSNVSVPPRPRGNDSLIYSLIEAKFDAQNECNLYKLKCEKLEEDKRRLEQELFDANSELESHEEGEGNGFMSILSGLPENIVTGFSKAAFENEQIRELIKSFFPKST